MQNCLRALRALAVARHGVEYAPAKQHVHVCSANNFPTAAGLASSAAGFACFVFTLGNLFDLADDIATLSSIARQVVALLDQDVLDAMPTDNLIWMMQAGFQSLAARRAHH